MICASWVAVVEVLRNPGTQRWYLALNQDSARSASPGFRSTSTPATGLFL
jgi:hypothetical protein